MQKRKKGTAKAKKKVSSNMLSGVSINDRPHVLFSGSVWTCTQTVSVHGLRTCVHQPRTDVEQVFRYDPVVQRCREQLHSSQYTHRYTRISAMRMHATQKYYSSSLQVCVRHASGYTSLSSALQRPVTLVTSDVSKNVTRCD